jgi:predicted site-specific integrase-resolvase
MTPKGDDELLTMEQTAKMLGIVRSTLYEWMAAGDIVPVPGNPLKKKQRRYFRREDIEKLLREGRSHKPAKTSD